MQCDPLEAIIKWLAADLALAQGRVAGKHRYGVETVSDGWSLDALGVVVSMDDGLGAIYGKLIKARMEINIYAPKREFIADAWRALEALADTKRRFTVTTSLGTVLVYCFNQQSGFSFVYDEDLQLEVGIVFYQAQVAKEVL